MRISILIVLFSFSIMGFAQSQTFKPAMDGIASGQDESLPGGFDIQFKTNGPLGRDWIYGSYLDEDSLTRCVAYRDGGRWVPLPFSGYYGNYATDIEMYGDTLYIAGAFGNVVQDSKVDTLPSTSILKIYNDSVWAGNPDVSPYEMASRGDSMLIWGGAGTIHPIYPHAISYDRGQNWQYPYSIGHPTGDSSNGVPAFGPMPIHRHALEILSNRDILTANHGSPLGSPFRGVVRWDGSTWHSYGSSGLYGGGSGSTVEDFLFYRGDLYIGGTFAQVVTYFGDTVYLEPRNPGNSIARWDGTNGRV